MKTNVVSKFDLFDDPLRLYNQMLDDIDNANDYIYLETYRFNNDSIGGKFRDAIARKCKEGIEVKLLLDSWGTPGSQSFFYDINKNGGEIRFFKKIRFYFDFFTKNHRRNHRKLLIIDDRIIYIGSANLTAYSLNWKELVLRMEHNIAKKFKNIFTENYKRYNKYVYHKIPFSRSIRQDGFEIVRDAPSIIYQRIKKKYENLIKKAQHEVIIETPYFLPGYLLRKVLMDAANRGVDVKIIVPHHSDVRLVDILRNKYLGQMHRNKVKFLFFKNSNLHAKMMMVDNKYFSIGSANFDYRSFRYMHEISVVGKEVEILKQLRTHVEKILYNCLAFDYEHWKKRPLIEKFFESLLVPFRHLF